MSEQDKTETEAMKVDLEAVKPDDTTPDPNIAFKKELDDFMDRVKDDKDYTDDQFKHLIKEANKIKPGDTKLYRALLDLADGYKKENAEKDKVKNVESEKEQTELAAEEAAKHAAILAKKDQFSSAKPEPKYRSIAVEKVLNAAWRTTAGTTIPDKKESARLADVCVNALKHIHEEAKKGKVIEAIWNNRHRGASAICYEVGQTILKKH